MRLVAAIFIKGKPHQLFGKILKLAVVLYFALRHDETFYNNAACDTNKGRNSVFGRRGGQKEI